MHSQSKDEKVKKKWQYNVLSSMKVVYIACCESVQERRCGMFVYEREQERVREQERGREIK